MKRPEDKAKRGPLEPDTGQGRATQEPAKEQPRGDRSATDPSDRAARGPRNT